MGLAKNFDEWRDAMRMQQLPIFHTMYADRDGRIMYVYNAAPPVREHGDHAYWNGVIPGDQSELIAGDKIVPFDQLPQAIDPPSGWVQNSNDSPWTSTYPVLIDPAKYRALHRAAAEPHAAIAARHPAAVRVGQDHARAISRR